MVGRPCVDWLVRAIGAAAAKCLAACASALAGAGLGGLVRCHLCVAAAVLLRDSVDRVRGLDNLQRSRDGDSGLRNVAVAAVVLAAPWALAAVADRRHWRRILLGGAIGLSLLLLFALTSLRVDSWVGNTWCVP